MSHRSTRSRTLPASLAVLILTVALAACGAAAAPSPSPTPAPTPTPVPGASGSTGGNIGGGGNTGGGIVNPPCCKGVPGGDPNLGEAQLVVPQPGQLDLHPASVVVIRAGIDGRDVTVELRWWSGVAPCTVLDSVKVERDGGSIRLTPFEGSSARDVACDMIAQLKATIVDLGDLDSGTYTISASGDPPSVEVTVS